MGAHSQKKYQKTEIGYKEHNRPYYSTSDEGLQFYLKAYTRRWLHAQDKGQKATLKWHMRALVTEIKLRRGDVDKR